MKRQTNHRPSEVTMAEPGRPERPWRRPAVVRGPEEEHRVASPLELFFDLCFVVGASQLSSSLHHALIGGHPWQGVVGFAVFFFAMLWAWMNYTWFANVHDSDDVVYRLLTLLQMAGVLVFAAGVPQAVAAGDLYLTVGGYVLMRISMVALWCRVGRADPKARPRAYRYAIGIAVVQVGWVLLALLVSGRGTITVALCAIPLTLAEQAVPIWAERHGPGVTARHAGHLSERYGLFALLVLGESVLGATVAIQQAGTAHVNAALVAVAVGGLLIAFCCWWMYFDVLAGHGPTTLRRPYIWGYGQFPMFAALAALGAGLETAVAALEAGPAEPSVPHRVAGLALTVPVVVFLLVLTLMEANRSGRPDRTRLTLWTTASILLTALGLFGSPPTVTLAAGLLLAILVAADAVSADRRYDKANGIAAESAEHEAASYRT